MLINSPDSPTVEIVATDQPIGALSSPRTFVKHNFPYMYTDPDALSMMKKRGEVKQRQRTASSSPAAQTSSLRTQIAIEANCKFSFLSVIEEPNFRMLFEAGEVMEMAFKSFPMFTI